MGIVMEVDEQGGQQEDGGKRGVGVHDGMVMGKESSLPDLHKKN